MILSDINIGWLLAGGAAVGAFWGQFKALCTSLRSLLMVKVSLNGEVALHVHRWMLANSSWNFHGDRNVRSRSSYVCSQQRRRQVAFENVSSDPAYFWAAGRLYKLVAHCYPNCPEASADQVSLFTMRWQFDMDAFIQRALLEGTELAARRFEIVHMMGASKRELKLQISSGGEPGGGVMAPPQNDGERGGRPIGFTLDDLRDTPGENFRRSVIKHAALLKLEKQVQFWLSRRPWYRERGLQWRRGALLSGVPGSGKSLAVIHCAMTADLPVVMMDIASMSNQELHHCWDKARLLAPCLLVIEDIDVVFHGRDNVSGGELTFDCLLNLMSGMDTANGMFQVVTTNYPEKLDEALTRPGRLDLRIEFTYLTEAEILDMCDRVLGSMNVPSDLMAANVTPARALEVLAIEAQRLESI